MTQAIIKMNQNLDALIANQLVELVSSYDVEVILEIQKQMANGRSIIGLISLSLKKGDAVKFVANGKDEELVLEKIQEKYGE